MEVQQCWTVHPPSRSDVANSIPGGVHATCAGSPAGRVVYCAAVASNNSVGSTP